MRLKELRKSRRLGQKEVADALSCSVTVYSRYETGTREPPIEALIRLADFYGVTLDELVGHTPVKIEVKKQAPPPLKEGELEIVIEPDQETPSAAELEKRIRQVVEEALKERGL